MIMTSYVDMTYYQLCTIRALVNRLYKLVFSLMIIIIVGSNYVYQHLLEFKLSCSKYIIIIICILLQLVYQHHVLLDQHAEYVMKQAYHIVCTRVIWIMEDVLKAVYV